MRTCRVETQEKEEGDSILTQSVRTAQILTISSGPTQHANRNLYKNNDAGASQRDEDQLLTRNPDNSTTTSAFSQQFVSTCLVTPNT